MRYFSDALFHTTSNGANGLLNPLESSVCYILYTVKFNTKNSTLCPHSGVMSDQGEYLGAQAESGGSTTGKREAEEEEEAKAEEE